MPPKSKAQLLGVRVDIVDWPDIDEFCRAALVQAAPKMITTVNGEIILLAAKDPNYRAILNRADLAIPDSTNVTWMGRLKGYKFSRPTPGSELVEHICEIAEAMNKSVFFLGGRDDVAKLTSEQMKDQYPDLEITGYSNADPTDGSIAEQIRRKNPDVVFVAYGAPKQEIWIDQNKEKVTAKIMVGVGGTFDMIAGKLPRAPQWMRSLRLEWLWRLILQPKRIIRVIKAVVIFPIRVLFS